MQTFLRGIKMERWLYALYVQFLLFAQHIPVLFQDRANNIREVFRDLFGASAGEAFRGENGLDLFVPGVYEVTFGLASGQDGDVGTAVLIVVVEE